MLQLPENKLVLAAFSVQGQAETERRRCEPSKSPSPNSPEASLINSLLPHQQNHDDFADER